MMLSPWAAPLLLPWLSRKGEQYADRTAADLGYGRPLVEVFANREFECTPADLLTTTAADVRVCKTGTAAPPNVVSLDRSVRPRRANILDE